MIFTSNLLFVHVPKTAGMSATRYLLAILPRPVYYTHPAHEKPFPEDGIVPIVGKRHETLEESSEILRQFGLEIRKLEVILAGVRNPYSLEVSRYAYLRHGHPWDRGRAQEIAINQGFEAFAIQSKPHGQTPIEDYFLLDGEMLPSLRVFRVEDLPDSLLGPLAEWGADTVKAEFPWVNRSRHADYLSYYTAEAEQAVYEKYRWIFEQGFYKRMDAKVAAQVRSRMSAPLPLRGPVRESVPRFGYWSDGWVAQRLVFSVHAIRDIEQLILAGSAPAALRDAAIAVSAPGVRWESSLPAGSFECKIDCEIEEGSVAEIEVKTSTGWSPRANGQSPDARRLSFHLKEAIFRPKGSTS